jgi:hypothetical protein
MSGVEGLKEALRDIAAMTDADNPDSYRSDDREGCLDAVHSRALSAIEGGGGSSAAPIPTCDEETLRPIIIDAYQAGLRLILGTPLPHQQAEINKTSSAYADLVCAQISSSTPSVATEQADGGVVVIPSRSVIVDAIRAAHGHTDGHDWSFDKTELEDAGRAVLSLLTRQATPPATPIAGGFGSSPDGDTHRAADTAVVGGQIAWRVGTPPQDGSTFYGHWWSPCRWMAYKPNSEQARRGVKGRWQTMNEFGGWVNASAPNEWATEAQIKARQQAAPASDTTARYEPEASDPKDAARRDEGAGQ